ncbi:MAG TPA: low temperature requirement protein A [Vicinamibacterales bacterium]|nr:low temperature requirement protein A [Vicinamibacterales bacterium]
MTATELTRAGASHRRRMRARSPHEPHRTATPLELLFDLVFVVAISEAAQGLHHALGSGHVTDGLLGYLTVFFAIWWAWMNFTWFASAYDCDDVPYRLAVFVQITGALILGGGVPKMFETQQLNLATVGGYVVMRMAAVTQWLRAGAADPERRTTTRRYALGVTLLQIAWVGLLFLNPRLFLPAFVVLAVLELFVPVWAERAVSTTWHPHHIAERYGLLTLIVLGETILAATMAVRSALDMGETFSTLAPLIIGGLLIVFSMWWYYFDRPVHDLLTSLRKAVVWGYGHYFVFAAAAAVGAGLTVAVDHAAHHENGRTVSVAGLAAAGAGARSEATGVDALGPVGAGAAVAIPVATYVLSLWFLHDRPEYRQTRAYGPIAAALILLTPFSGHAVLLTGIVLASTLAVKLLVLGGTPHEASSS